MKHLSHAVRDVESLTAFLCAPEVVRAHRDATTSLVQIYTAETDLARIEELRQIVAEHLTDAVIVGATTIGEIIDGHTVTGQTVIGFTFFETSRATAISSTCAAGDERQTGLELRRQVDAREDQPIAGVLLLATPLSIDAAALLKSFETPPSAYQVFGGGAGDYATMNQSAVFTNDAILTHGVVAVVFAGPELHIDSRTYLGWRPLSKEMTVTRTEGMVVKTVDDRPAFDLYRRYLDIPDDDDFFLNVLEFPFLIERGDTVLARVPVAVDAEDGLHFVADVHEGETFRIGYGDPNLIISDATDIHIAAARFSPQSIYLYTCGCRRFLMQEDTNLETHPFASIAPTFGFYTYGEFFRRDETIQLLNSTMVAVSLREGERPARVDDPRAIEDETQDSQDPYANKHARIISRLVHFVAAVTSELDQANREITKLSVTDRLTGLHNRMKLDTVLAEAMTRAARYQEPLSIILLDIDHFKQVNDTHGHLVGDDVLVRVAAVLGGLIRDVDTLGRWGGEEFLLILPHTDLEHAAMVADKLRRAVGQETLPVVGPKTASFGVASHRPGDTATDLLARADQALYDAKHTGRDKVCTA